jgi:hypothetical protein
MQVAELTADLRKLNAQLELSKSVSHVAENYPWTSAALRVKDWQITNLFQLVHSNDFN